MLIAAAVGDEKRFDAIWKLDQATTCGAPTG